jgi:hypothetical protein
VVDLGRVDFENVSIHSCFVAQAKLKRQAVIQTALTIRPSRFDRASIRQDSFRQRVVEYLKKEPAFPASIFIGLRVVRGRIQV